MNRKREPTRIIYEILMLARGECTKTRVATRTGQNFLRASKYVELLSDKGHLDKRLFDGQFTYSLSAKGRRFLSGLEALKRDLDELFTLPRQSMF